MIRTMSIAAAGCLLTAGLAATALPVSAATAPSLKLTTKTLAVTVPSKLVASHLTPKKVYFIMVAQPSLKNKKVQGLVGFGKTDAKGHFSATIKAPVTAKCGPATVYALRPKSKSIYSLKVTVSGCNAPKATVAPPPPPKP